MMSTTKTSKAAWAWALGDWANSAYTTTVIAVFFPIFFKQYWASSLSATESTFYLGLANSTNSIILCLIAPILGALADIGGKKKRLLVFTAFIGASALVPLYFVYKDQWTLALLFFTLSNVGYWASNIFYDSLLIDVSDKDNISFVSSLGYALGYLGGGLLVILNAAMVMSPKTFGLSDQAQAVKWSFISVSLWWLVFLIPIWLWVPEEKNHIQSPSLIKAFKQVLGTLRKIRKFRSLFLFLIAYIFYIDGVNTIIKMAVDFALAIGLDSTALIKAIILVQFIAFPATLIYAWIANKIGDRPAIFMGLGIYTGITVYSSFIHTETQFYILAAVVGLAQGGLQAISRSYYGKMVPKEFSGEFFGFYNMLGKFSAILGPFFVGLLSLLTNSPRVSILVVLIFFVIGGAILLQVRDSD